MTTTSTKSTINNKASYVNQIFSNIATKYDLLNNLMTFGLHKSWKNKLIKLALCEIPNPKDALDLCSGTCDLGIILNKYCLDTNILCIDNASPMLEIGKRKIEKLKLSKIKIQKEDVDNLSSMSQSFDLITIGFGLRNLVNREKCIESIWKLLRSNGVFACIDLGYPENLIWRDLFFMYFFNLVPKLGELFAKNKEAYSYLPKSLLAYYKQEELKDVILSKGFKKCFYKNILGGVVAIHIAVK